MGNYTNLKIWNISQILLTKFIIMVVSAALLSGCGGGAKEEKTSTSENEAPPSSGVAENGLVKLVISGDDLMRFDKEELRVKAGAKVELTLNHSGQLPKEAMGHNVVILKPGTDLASYAEKAFAAKANDYIPEGNETIAYTKLIGGGESTTITFDAPPEGTYDFICSFPGHYALMKGKFIVE